MHPGSPLDAQLDLRRVAPARIICSLTSPNIIGRLLESFGHTLERLRHASDAYPLPDSCNSLVFRGERKWSIKKVALQGRPNHRRQNRDCSGLAAAA